MGNINMPAPVAFAGGALCLLSGYLIGVVAGPATQSQTTAEVVSFDRRTQELCLTGEAVADRPEAEDGVFCGTWRHATDFGVPEPGQTFRFVAMTSRGESDEDRATYIYGDVVE